jgi:hypothetical protein
LVASTALSTGVDEEGEGAVVEVAAVAMAEAAVAIAGALAVVIVALVAVAISVAIVATAGDKGALKDGVLKGGELVAVAVVDTLLLRLSLLVSSMLFLICGSLGVCMGFDPKSLKLDNGPNKPP